LIPASLGLLYIRRPLRIFLGQRGACDDLHKLSVFCGGPGRASDADVAVLEHDAASSSLSLSP
jgi:hypothetical protein